jgi:hypothetical protein
LTTVRFSVIELKTERVANTVHETILYPLCKTFAQSAMHSAFRCTPQHLFHLRVHADGRKTIGSKRLRLACRIGGQVDVDIIAG